MMKKSNRSNVLVYVPVIAAALLVAIGISSMSLISDAYVTSGVRKNVSGLVSLSAILTILLSGFALFKTKKWSRVIPVVSIIISLAVFCIAIFAYGFSGYGSPN